MTIDIIVWIRKRLLRYLARLVRSGNVKANEVGLGVVELVAAGLGPEKDVLGFYNGQSDGCSSKTPSYLLTNISVKPAEVQDLKNRRNKGFR